MRILIFILLILNSYGSYGQIDFDYDPNVLSKRVKEIVSILNSSKIIEGRSLYYSGEKSSIYPEFEKLSNRANLDELKELIKHPNPVVRYYSYEALLNRDIENEKLFFYIIAKQHLIDTSRVITQDGCLTSSLVIGDYIYSTSKFRLNEEYRKTLDSLLFWGANNQISSRNKLFSTIEHNESNYQRLKEILENEGNLEALIPILSYNREDDRKLINQYCLIAPKHIIDAMSINPREEYLDEIIAIQNNIIPELLSNQSWIKIYKIGLQLGQEVSLQIFDNGLSLPNSKSVNAHAKFIHWAIKDNGFDYLDRIRLGTLPFLNNMDLDYFERTWSYDSLKTYNILVDRFSNDNHPYWQEELINLMTDKIEGFLEEEAIDFINMGIANGYSITYYTLSNRARKYKNIETVNILVQRFNEEEGKHEQDIYYRIKGILNYDDNIVYEQIEEKAFSFLNDPKLGIYSDSVIELGMRCNRNRCIENLLVCLEENNMSEMFLNKSITALIQLDDLTINQRLANIYELNKADYKKTRFGKRFYDLLQEKN